MSFFEPIKGAYALVRHGPHKGVFSEYPLVRMGRDVFIKKGPNHFRVCTNGQVSSKGMIWEEIHLDQAYYFNEFGRLTLGLKQVPEPRKKRA